MYLLEISFKILILNSPSKRASHKMFSTKATQVVCVWQGKWGIKKELTWSFLSLLIGH